jgi:alpha-beta hydrolase superfamily lysophospholipase
MKHIMYAEKTLLIGDETADLAIEYAAVLANHGKADTVTLNAFDADGDTVKATLLLNSGTNIVAATSHNSLEEPDNAEAVAYIREKMLALSSPRFAKPHGGVDDDAIDIDMDLDGIDKP